MNASTLPATHPEAPARTRPGARSGAVALAVAGVLFVLYPVVRPYSDETSMGGAVAMASPAWLAAHLFAVAGFILLSLGLLGLHQALGQRLSLRAVVVTWAGAGLTLPYYGAETFGLNVIAHRAVQDQSTSLLALVDEFRYGPAAVVMFGCGLLLLGVGVVLAAVAVWRSGALPRWSAVPIAVGFALFIPQFFGPNILRIAEGALIALGGVWLGVELWRAR
ncbi:hypothetical protein AB0O34_31220 [Sphaerisporangium sp. NPDC088356]|uniref:hypothetical protein n=1 Tax=Sphaerisporangium sp. NPDC088356 TaxID=3154871 RepID=UPI003416F842